MRSLSPLEIDVNGGSANSNEAILKDKISIQSGASHMHASMGMGLTKLLLVQQTA